jgi:hypothetical protein
MVNSNPAAGSDEARVANYYKAYTNTNAIEQRGVATDHHREGALLGPARSATHRRVEESDAVLGEARRDAT